MPEPGQEVLYIMNLHARCRSNNALPKSGGVLDQPAYIMDMFDVIDCERTKIQNRAVEREADEAAKAAQFQGLRHAR